MRKTSRAVLIKLATDDGLCRMKDGIEIGTVYQVDLSTRAIVCMVHKSGVLHQKEIVDAGPRYGQGAGGWLPTELLAIDDAEEPDICPRCGRAGPLLLCSFPLELLRDERGVVWGEETIELCEECAGRMG